MRPAHILQALVNSCWFCFRWGIALTIACALGLGVFLYARLDDEIRLYVTRLLTQHYRGLEVQVASARFSMGRGVTVYGIRVLDPRLPAGHAELLRIEELRLEGDFDVACLTSGRPVVRAVTVLRPTLSVAVRPDGRPTVSKLWPPPRLGASAPPLQILDASVALRDWSRPGSPPVVIRHARLKVDRDAAAAMRFEGGVEDSLARRIGVAGSATPGGAVEARLTAEDLVLSHDRLAALPIEGLRAAEGLRFDARADVAATLRCDGPGRPVAWSCAFGVRHATLSHPSLPAPITGLMAQGACDSSSLRIDKATGQCGPATLSVTCGRRGWGDTAPCVVRVAASRVALDDALHAALPEQGRALWRRLKPSGVVDLHEATATFDGACWRLDALAASVRDAGFEDAEKFPYRVRNATGSLRVEGPTAGEPSRLTAQLEGDAEGRPVQIAAEFRGCPLPGAPTGACPGVTGWIDVSSPAMRVSEKLLAALPDKAERLVRSLRPEGEFAVHWRLEKPTPGAPLSPALDLEVLSGAIRYEKFPYPLSQITGRVRQRGGRWEFDQFVSRDGAGRQLVTASGRLDTTQPATRLDLWLHGAALPMDAELRQALPPAPRVAWDALRPAGAVDFAVEASYTQGAERPELRIAATPSGESVSIEPAAFPYRLEKVRGKFEYGPEGVGFTGAGGVHGAANLGADGRWFPTPEGGWRLELRGLTLDQFDLAGDVRRAAPPRLRQAIDRLRPTGAFAVSRGDVAITCRAPADPAPRVEWDLRLDCVQAALDCGAPITDLYGAVQLRGSATGDDFRTTGELDLDNAVYRGLQLTAVRGPLWGDRNEVRLGSGVAQLASGEPRPVLARAYGGELRLDARMVQAEQPEFGVRAQLTGLDLAQLNADYLRMRGAATGKVDGRIDLHGVGASNPVLTGVGSVSVREAQIYELPILVSMLKVLRNRAPDTTAFDGVDAQFTLAGQHLTFQRIDLLGDAVSLYGRGDAGLDHSVNLVFHTMVGRNELAVPMLRSFVGQASEQFLRLSVTGTVEDAKVTREALPIVGNMLQQLQADLRPRGPANASAPGRALQR